MSHQSPITIGIDANEANVKNRVGSNVFSFQILKYLHQLQSQSFSFRVYLKNNPLLDMPKETDCWKYKVLKPGFLWTQWRLPLELYWQKQKPDVFFTPGHYAPRFCPIPLVIAIMDLAFLRYPNQFKKNDLYQLVHWTKYSVKNASRILTISEFSKKEIINFYNYPKEKITVIYPGINIDIKNKRLKIKNTFQNLKRKYRIDKENYFLYVGTLQPRKNLVRLIKAFKILINHPRKMRGRQSSTINHQPLVIDHLLIVGKKGWLYKDIFQKVKELGLKNKVIFTGFISEEEKNVLLKNAFAFILPSLYEGFGIPVLEAMKAGCPVIVSRNSSLPEAAGDAAIYINNPYSVDSIYQMMLKMIKLKNKQRKLLVEKGFKQVKKFSWEKSTKKTLEKLLLMKRSEIK